MTRLTSEREAEIRHMDPLTRNEADLLDALTATRSERDALAEKVKRQGEYLGDSADALKRNEALAAERDSARAENERLRNECDDLLGQSAKSRAALRKAMMLLRGAEYWLSTAYGPCYKNMTIRVLMKHIDAFLSAHAGEAPKGDARE